MRFDITFNHGNLENTTIREMVEATDSEDAMDKAYDIAYKRGYWKVDIWVSEHQEGLCNYNCVVDTQYYLDGKIDDYKGEIRLSVMATSYEDAKSQARKKYIGKYYYKGEGKLGAFRCLSYGDTWLKEDTELFDKPLDKGQSVRLYEITDCYQ